MGNNFMFIIIILAAIAIFFLCRELMCWYWKINQHIENQERIIFLLQRLVKKNDLTECCRSDIKEDPASITDSKIEGSGIQVKPNKKNNESKMMYALYGAIIIGVIIAYLFSGK